MVFKDTTGTYRRLNTFKQAFNLPSALGRLVSRVSQTNSLHAQVKRPPSNAWRRSMVMATEYHTMLFHVSEACTVLHAVATRQ